MEEHASENKWTPPFCGISTLTPREHTSLILNDLPPFQEGSKPKFEKTWTFWSEHLAHERTPPQDKGKKTTWGRASSNWATPLANGVRAGTKSPTSSGNTNSTWPYEDKRSVETVLRRTTQHADEKKTVPHFDKYTWELSGCWQSRRPRLVCWHLY
jgi:hypothetical protein